MGSRQEWHKIMRQTIKLENGDGWSVRGREIKVLELVYYNRLTINSNRIDNKNGEIIFQ